MPLPVGLVYDPSGKVVLDPDTSVQNALRHVFATFARTGSARAVVYEYTRELFPTRIRTGHRTGELAWTELEHSRVLRTLHNRRVRVWPTPEPQDPGREDDLAPAATRAMDRADP